MLVYIYIYDTLYLVTLHTNLVNNNTHSGKREYIRAKIIAHTTHNNHTL